MPWRWPRWSRSPPSIITGVFQAAGLLFFAFAGYARIATLGEEVRDPARTIPRAIPLALGVTLAVYLLVATAGLAAVGPAGLAATVDLRGAIGFSSFAVLTYYAIANASALTLPGPPFGRVLPVVGLAGCV